MPRRKKTGDPDLICAADYFSGEKFSKFPSVLIF